MKETDCSLFRYQECCYLVLLAVAHNAVLWSLLEPSGLAEWIRNHVDVLIAAGAVVWTKYIGYHMVQTCRGIMQKHHWLWFGLDTHIASPFKILPWVLVCAPCPAVAAATSGLLQHCSGKPVQYCRRVLHQHQWQRGGEGVNRIGIGIGRRIFIWLGREARRSY